jgi:predicted nucleic acid-binding protein
VKALLDTSVLIALEQDRRLDTDRLPDELAVSVVTIAELELGVHLAGDEAIRRQRLETLRSLDATYEPLPIDRAVASRFAELVAAALRAGRRARVQDAWIAATALAHDASVCTQDRDYEVFAGLDVIRI